MGLVRKIGFFSAFILPALVVAGVYLGGHGNALTLFFVFLVIPVLDYVVGLDTHNVPAQDKTVVGEAFYYRLITYTWVFIQLAFLFWCAMVIAEGRIQRWHEWIYFTVGVALVTGGIGITVAHELGHKKSSWEKLCSQVLLMTVGYMHFYIEHNRGHHVHVATPQDPATARKGENFYQFWVRSVTGSWRHAWQLASESRKREGKSVHSPAHPMVVYTLLPFLFIGLVTWAAQPSGAQVWMIPLFLVAQSVLAFSLLELVNYIEHYGILRKIDAGGRYERVNPLHSWNASHLISNFFLFQLQRHSDHHAHASKRYQVLDHVDESPQLPFGYPTMILIALVPPLWFSMMDPRLRQWEHNVYWAA